MEPALLSFAEEPRLGPALLPDPQYALAWRLADAFLQACGPAFPLADAFAGVTADAERALFTHGEVRRGGLWAWFQLEDPYLAVRLRDQLLTATGLTHLMLGTTVDPTARQCYLFLNQDQNLRQAHPTWGNAAHRQGMEPLAISAQQTPGGWTIRLPDAPYQLVESLGQALTILTATASEHQREVVIQAEATGVTARWRHIMLP